MSAFIDERKADLVVELHAAGDRYRFDADVNSEKGYVRFRKQISRAQARLGWRA